MYIRVFKASTYITIDSSGYIMNIHVVDTIRKQGNAKTKRKMYI